MDRGKTTRRMTNEKTDITIKSLLTEYEVAQNDIATNYRQRYILISLNITSIGVLLGLTTSMVNPIFLAIMSIVSSCFGIIWVAENRWSTRSYNHIANYIAPRLRNLAGEPDLFKSDEEIRKGWTYSLLVKSIVTGEGPGTQTVLLLFFLPSLVSFGIATFEVIAQTPLQTGYHILLLLADFSLLCILGLSGWKWFDEWNIKSK